MRLKIILSFVFLAVSAFATDGSVWSLLDQGKYDGVLKLYRQTNPEDRSREINLAAALAYRAIDSLNNAIEIYENLISENETDYNALQGLALTLS